MAIDLFSLRKEVKKMTRSVNVQVDQKSKYAVITASGEVDLYSSPQLRNRIMELLGKKTAVIIIDLTQVSYMDSSGVATLVEGLQKSESYNGDFILCGLNSMVSEVFELTRLNTVFKIFDDLESAKQAALKKS
jgi:anti-sigma B factor antagonist